MKTTSDNLLVERELSFITKWYNFLKILVVVLISIVTCLIFYFWQIEITIINIIAATAFVATLSGFMCYLIDWFSIRLYILQVGLTPTATENKFLIKAQIYNFGGRIASNCICEIIAKQKESKRMDFVPIDMPTGRPKILTPYKEYPLLPKTPIWVREYETLTQGQEVEIILLYKGIIRDVRFIRRFRTPSWIEQRKIAVLAMYRH